MTKKLKILRVIIHDALAFSLCVAASPASPSPSLAGVKENGAPSGRWVSTSSMTTIRNHHGATLLPSGELLVTGGVDASGTSLSSAECLNPSTGIWREKAGLATPRADHTATLLLSGDVLVVGGTSGENVLSPAELYEPGADTWHVSGQLRVARKSHTATLLPSGEVLVVGGSGANGPLNGVEIYDPRTATWRESGQLSTGRFGHTATLLPSGQVLVAGGTSVDGTSTREVEIFDPEAGTWMKAARLLKARSGHTATLLTTGEILVAGGESAGSLLADSELYDPREGTWRKTAFSPTFRRRNHTATLLPSGDVLVTGGQNESDRENPSINLQAEIYDPGTEAWILTGVSEQAREAHSATLMPSGEVLVVGTSANADLYSPIIETWQEIPGADSVLKRQRDHTATLLPTGEVLVAGGISVPHSSWIYDSFSGDWESTAGLVNGRRLHTATLISSGTVLVAGGVVGSGFTSTVELFDAAERRWREGNPLSAARAGHTATLLASGKVLVVGGEDSRSSLRSAELYDPASGEWEPTGDLITSRSVHSATLLASGKVLVAGGAIVSNPPQGPRIIRGVSSAEIYDPSTGIWETTGPLATARLVHTATLLRSGKVLVVGGQTDPDNGSVNLKSAEIYDPISGNWRETTDLEVERFQHAATLLPSGDVLVVGGEEAQAAEVYHTAIGNWTRIEPPKTEHEQHTATLLPSGRVLVVGGNGVELFRPERSLEDRRPLITDAAATLRYGEPLTITGTGFRGDFEASDGTSRSSPVNFPLFQLRSLSGDPSAWLVPERLPATGGGLESVTIRDLPPIFDPGPHLLSVVTAGIASEPKPIDLECSLAITRHPDPQTVAIGSTATFSVETQGGRFFQWQKDGIDIPGATAPRYVTPPISAADSGTVYQVRIDSGCTRKVSRAAVLTVADGDAPEVRVVSPVAGEFWLLTDPGQARNTRTVSWEMSDNVRICSVAVQLRFSSDGRASWKSVTLARFDQPDSCPYPGAEASSLIYQVPVDPPSGVAGSLYQIQVKVTDHAGLSTVARSGTFFIVRPNNDTVKTLILTNIGRMRDQEVMGITNRQVRFLRQNLQELASHPRVQGFIYDLGADNSLSDLYEEWDLEPADFQKANAVLFDEGGLHQRLRGLLEIFTGVESLILVGDDRIIPFARVRDRTVEFPESNYTYAAADDEPDFDFSPPGLVAEASTVGMALAANQYLSDDPLAVLEPVSTKDLQEDGVIFLPDLAIGRLVETPEEIATAISAFIGQDGVLDLAQLDDPAQLPQQTGRKVLVTGYDFLVDSSRRIAERWQRALLGEDDVDQTPDDLRPVDSQLLGSDWGIAGDGTSVERRRQALEQHLTGFGEGPYGILSLNGHATHFEEGVPSNRGSFDIQGLATARITETCRADARLCLTGSVVYAVGCHGGLPVAGSSDPRDRNFDLPQTMLGARALAYVANTGYGWGLVHGIGYSERLVEIMTEEITRGGVVVVGEAVKRSKERYFLELARVDPYDAKTLMQWSFFGFPMYAVRTGIAPDNLAAGPLFAGVPTAAEKLARSEWREGVAITRDVAGGVSAAGELKVLLPDFLTVVEQRFEFGDQVYVKHVSSGERVPENVEGCPDPKGCYYTLNGLSTGTEELPIQPFFVFDSRLAGTSQHGILWKGGTYEEESHWVPLTARLASNGGSPERISTPRRVYLQPRGPMRHRRSLDGGDAELCRHSDLELNSVVLTTGETIETVDGFDLNLHREVELEVFYYNNTFDPAQNCDREPPLFRGESFHRVSGTTVIWEVPEIDAGSEGDGVWDSDNEIWRLVVVFDREGSGTWAPLELEKSGGLWRGSLQMADSDAGSVDLFRLTYYVQAVDRRGNVGWLEAREADCSPADCPRTFPGIPLPVEVVIEPGAADLEVTMSDEQDPVGPDGLIIYTVEVRNSGPAPASALSATITLDDDVDYVIGGGEGWICSETAVSELECARDTLKENSATTFSLAVRAPSVSGTLSSSVVVKAVERDPTPANNRDSEITRVVQP